MVVRSPTITVQLGDDEGEACPFWMNRFYLFAKRFGLVNLQKRLEELAVERGCTLA